MADLQSAGPDAEGVAEVALPTQASHGLHRVCTDTDLARVVGAWPDLPETIRRAILALVGTAR